jgi:hypothetical protein
MSTSPKLYEDGVFSIDPSKLIDYPKVKLKSFDKEEKDSLLFKWIILFTCMISFISGALVIFL